jgi:hypothetical protein
MPGNIRRAALGGICLGPQTTTVANLRVGLDFPKSVAVGNFNGTGTFGIYFTSGTQVQRVVADAMGGLTQNVFADLSPFGALSLHAVEFDPVSGDLFVSEDTGGSQDRILRINAAGSARLFGDFFNLPNGIAFHPSGVMLVSEDQNVLVVDGWRNLFLRGDASGNGAITIADSSTILNWLYSGAAPPPCFDAADVDDNSQINISDPVFLNNFLFQGGPAPPAPGATTCGRDPTADLLGCITSAGVGCPIP